MAQVHQTPHEDLNIWSGMKETGHGSGLVCIDCVKVFCVCWPLWCWEAKGWKCLAYCRASICLQIPPLSRLMKYKRCSLNSRLLLRSKRRCRFVTAHLRKTKMKHTQSGESARWAMGNDLFLYNIKHWRTLVPDRGPAFAELRGFCSAPEMAASYSYLWQHQTPTREI